MAHSDEIKVRLLESDEEYRQLAAQHRGLEQRLTLLATKAYPTDDDKDEQRAIKKQKLRLKDQMEDILRRRRGVLDAPAPAPAPASSPARG